MKTVVTILGFELRKVFYQIGLYAKTPQIIFVDSYDEFRTALADDLDLLPEEIVLSDDFGRVIDADEFNSFVSYK